MDTAVHTRVSMDNWDPCLNSALQLISCMGQLGREGTERWDKQLKI